MRASPTIRTNKMKSLISVLFCLIFFSQATAQVQKGTILTGGSFSFDNQKNTEEFSVFSSFVLDELERTFITARPQIGFFANESTLIGIGVAYEHNSFERLSSFNGSPDDPLVEKSNIFLINPYLEKYSKLTDQLYFTTGISFSVGLGARKYEFTDELETDIIALRFNISPGLTYFISNKWALSAGIGRIFYDWEREQISTDIGLDPNPKNIDRSYGVSFSFNTFRIAFQYLLNNRSNQIDAQ